MPAKRLRPHDHNGARDDSLPEFHTYVDSGCNLFSSCLSCPFAQCRHDGGTSALSNSISARNRTAAEREKALALHNKGVWADEIAPLVGVGERTVYRWLKDAGIQLPRRRR